MECSSPYSRLALVSWTFASKPRSLPTRPVRSSRNCNNQGKQVKPKEDWRGMAEQAKSPPESGPSLRRSQGQVSAEARAKSPQESGPSLRRSQSQVSAGVRASGDESQLTVERADQRLVGSSLSKKERSGWWGICHHSLLVS